MNKTLYAETIIRMLDDLDKIAALNAAARQLYVDGAIICDVRGPFVDAMCKSLAAEQGLRATLLRASLSDIEVETVAPVALAAE